jgi:cytochrome P450
MKSCSFCKPVALMSHLFSLAGHETTANSLSNSIFYSSDIAMFLYELAKHPNIQQEIYKECHSLNFSIETLSDYK